MRIVPNRLGKLLNKAFKFHLLFGVHDRTLRKPRLVLAVFISLSHIGGERINSLINRQSSDFQRMLSPNGDGKRSEL
jgi:hypothetical protein